MVDTTQWFDLVTQVKCNTQCVTQCITHGNMQPWVALLGLPCIHLRLLTILQGEPVGKESNTLLLKGVYITNNEKLPQQKHKTTLAPCVPVLMNLQHCFVPALEI